MNELTIPMTRAEKLILEKVTSLEKKIEEMREEKISESIAEISLGKSAKLLRLGSETVIGLVKSGKLKARTYRDNNRVKRYRFRIADIREFQKNNSTVLVSGRPIVKTAEEIASEIFNNKHQR